MSNRYPNQTAFVCDLTALNAEQRKRYQVVLEKLQDSVQEVKEVANGYAFRHPAHVSVLLLLAEFIRLERRCCPFLDFTLKVETEHGPAWLTVTGPKGVKEFLEMELGIDGNLP